MKETFSSSHHSNFNSNNNSNNQNNNIIVNTLSSQFNSDKINLEECRLKKEVFNFYSNYLVCKRDYSEKELQEFADIYNNVALNLVYEFEKEVAANWRLIQTDSNIQLWDTMDHVGTTESKIASKNEWKGGTPLDCAEYASNWNQRYEYDRYLGQIGILYYYCTNNPQIAKDLKVPLTTYDVFILEMKTNPITIFSQRYSVLVNLWGPHPVKKGSYISITKSVPITGPGAAGAVRAECPLYGYLFEPVPGTPNSAITTHICHFELGKEKNYFFENLIVPLLRKYTPVNLFYKVKFMTEKVGKGYKAQLSNPVNNFINNPNNNGNNSGSSTPKQEIVMVDVNNSSNSSSSSNSVGEDFRSNASLKDYDKITFNFTKEPNDWLKYFLEKEEIFKSTLRSFPSNGFKIPVFYEIQGELIFLKSKFHICQDSISLTSYLYDQNGWDPFIYKIIHAEKGMIVHCGGVKISKKLGYDVPLFSIQCRVFLGAKETCHYILEERDNGDCILFLIEPSVINNQSMVSVYFQIHAKNWKHTINPHHLYPSSTTKSNSSPMYISSNNSNNNNNNNKPNIFEYLYNSFVSFKSNFSSAQNTPDTSSPKTNSVNSSLIQTLNLPPQTTIEKSSPSQLCIKVLEIFSMIIDHSYSVITSEISLIHSIEGLSIGDNKLPPISNNINNNSYNINNSPQSYINNNNNNSSINNSNNNNNPNNRKNSLNSNNQYIDNKRLLSIDTDSYSDMNAYQCKKNKISPITYQGENSSFLLPKFIPQFNETNFFKNYNNQKESLELNNRHITNLFTLPHEIIISFLSFLDYHTLCTISRTCKYLKAMAESDLLWYRLYFNFFGESRVLRSRYSDKNQYKQVTYSYKGLWDNYVKSNFQLVPNEISFNNPSLTYFLSKETSYETINGYWKKDFFLKIRMEILWKISKFYPPPKQIRSPPQPSHNNHIAKLSPTLPNGNNNNNNSNSNNNNNNNRSNIQMMSIFSYSISPSLFELTPDNDDTQFTSILLECNQVFLANTNSESYYIDFSCKPHVKPVKLVPPNGTVVLPSVHLWSLDKYLFSGLSDRTVIKYTEPESDGTQCNYTFQLHNPKVPSNWSVGGISNSYYGEQVAVNYYSNCEESINQDFDTILDIFDVESHKLLYTIDLENEGIATSNIHKTRVAIGGVDGLVNLYDLHTGKKITSFLGNTDSIYCLKILPDEDIVITSSSDGSVRFFDERTGPHYIKRFVDELHVKSFDFEPRKLLCGGGPRLSYWDPRNLSTHIGQLYGPPTPRHSDITKVILSQFKVMVLYSSGVSNLWDFV
ncbi:WD40 repeat-containing protein [Tieghemostelium lacteum]|uniref:WD40 repeat-containing protein n=1 Tax=Tieghemostelium lacteum TaxID=361077 RepID=A0A151Z644_TIELA|nr:WD40 repeat-containing protein [Tieghemostelium lacteum]|eukprot:KYQ89431.1 WD40 repeat-containing protein [Tieghemostelium lacteum]